MGTVSRDGGCRGKCEAKLSPGCVRFGNRRPKGQSEGVRHPSPDGRGPTGTADATIGTLRRGPDERLDRARIEGRRTRSDSDSDSGG